jgi:site-specific DNA-methyltransferase (adenine-specific)
MANIFEKNKTYLGDCLELMHEIEDNSIDMIFCDLPYNITACDWDCVIDLKLLWQHYNRIIKPNSAIILTATQPFTTTLINSNRSGFKYCWYWNKENAGNWANAKYMPQKTIEDILVFSKDGKTVRYFPIMENIEADKIRPIRVTKRHSNSPQGMSGETYIHKDDYDNTKRYPKTLLTYNSRAKELNSSARLHPTQKPLSLLEYLITTYTNEGETVLDNCAGSGTTGEACFNTGRSYIQIEKEQKYFDLILGREKSFNKKDYEQESLFGGQM